MQFLTKQEFSVLSEAEKSDYYEALIEEKNEAVTVSQFETLMIEFEKLNYKELCCVLFYFYIKPQHRRRLALFEFGCVLFYFYIKPQHFAS